MSTSHLLVLIFVILLTSGRGDSERDCNAGRPEPIQTTSETRPSGSFHVIKPSEPLPQRTIIGHRYRGRNVRDDAAAGVHTIEAMLERMSATLNERILLPDQVYVSFETCDYPDSYFDDSTNKIVVCTELVDEFYRMFRNTASQRAKLNEKVTDALAFFFMHEVAHALISDLNLPITGREEDAADQFSVLMLLGAGPDGGRIALAGAESFNLYAILARQMGEPRAFWDEHSQDEQRYFDTLCLVYGSDPSRFQDLANNGRLPLTRAWMCPGEYSRASRSWAVLLKGFEKRASKAAE